MITRKISFSSKGFSQKQPNHKLLGRTPVRSTAMATRASSQNLFVGIDFGTSGARRILIDEQGAVLDEHKVKYSDKLPPDFAWSVALFQLLSLPEQYLESDAVKAIAIDGTSSTTMLLDASSGEVLAPPKMYNEAQSTEVCNIAKSIAPPDHTVTSSTSTLCKVLTWHQEGLWQRAESVGIQPIILHQADWLASLLHGNRRITDWNNCLKLGFDCETLSYPDWLMKQEYSKLFPTEVVAPGTAIGCITQEVVEKTGLSPKTIVCSGTTDSIAAFLAAGVDQPGQAVTSLGSTIAIKLLSTNRVEDAKYGIYSHRLDDYWLVGGASNSGGAVLAQYFTNEQLAELTPRIDISKPSGLDYVVLPSKGERFPVNDPDLEPKLEPRPSDDAVFLQGMFEAMSRTEGNAYRVLTALGATPVTEVVSAGGGAANPVWEELRRRELGVGVRRADQGEAAYGAALLARKGWMKAMGSRN